jgi:threonine-phosphate decarboxylase
LEVIYLDTFSHGGKVFEASKELGLPPEAILDFSANINPIGFPGGVADIIKGHIKDIVHYPDPDQREMLAAAAEFFGTDSHCILAGNGSVELINLIAEGIRPKKAIIPAPTFSEYGHSCSARNIPVEFVEIPQTDFKLDGKFLRRVLEKSEEGSLVIICNPNNPTGQLVPRSELLSLLEALEKRDSYLLLDEAFMDFVEDSYSLVDQIGRHSNLIILRSLTKFFALPGLRIGFALSNPDTIKRLSFLKDPWNINTFAGTVAPYVMKDTEYIEKTKRLIGQEKEWLWRELRKIPDLLPLNPEANYIFIKMVGDTAADVLTEKLKKRGILIRLCANYPFLDRRFFRVAVKDRRANASLVEAIREAIGGNCHE